MKHLFTLLFLFFTLSLTAQNNKGKVYLAGNTNFNFTSETSANQEQRVALQSARVGYFLSNRFLLGTDLYVGSRENRQQIGSNSSYYLRPFLRYYLSNRGNNKLNYFGQIGMFTAGSFGFGTNFETDFHFGGGVEIGLYDGLVATALLRYRARAYGLNYTELELGLNVLVGGNQGGAAPLPQRGDLLIDPTFGSLQLGIRNRSEENVSHLIGNLRLNGLYFLTDKLLLEAGFGLNIDQYDTDTSNSFEGRRVGPKQTNIQSWVGARRLFSNAGRLRPYLSGRLVLDAQRIESESFFINGNRVVSSTTNFYAALGAGAFYYLTDRIALDASVHWHSPTSGGQSFTQARIGLKVLLPKKLFKRK